MAGWSTLRDGYGVNCDEICQGRLKFRVESVNVNSMEEGKDEEEGTEVLRGLFDQVLAVFLKELCAKDTFRPIPPLVGDGQSIDLFRLFCLVRKRGGFNSVSKEKLWGLVAESLDLDFRFSASLKLMYFKYLHELDQWLDKINGDGHFVNKGVEYGGELEPLLVELEKRFRGLFMDVVKLVKIETEDILGECDEICDRVDVAISGNLQIPGDKRESKLLVDANVPILDDDEKNSKCEVDRSVGRIDPFPFERDFNNRKRKRHGWQGMLIWLKNAARNPLDLSNGRIPHRSEWNENGGKEPWSLALFVREAMLKRRYPNSKNDGDLSNQKKQKVHPTIYDDRGSGNLEGVRFSKRVPALAKSPKCSCCDSSSTKENKLANHCKVSHPKKDPEETKKKHCKVSHLKKDPEETKKEKTPDFSQPSEPTDRSSLDKLPVEKHVNVGPQFQAEIPPWTGEVSDTDCNRVGIRVWPPESWEEDTSTEIHPGLELGVGRPSMCDCPFPGSVTCVRFHTAENKMKLKHELGKAFYQWKFDRMGEVVSLSWTPQEEEKFKSIMSTTPLSRGRSSFRRKTRQELIDYYFNVFLQCKRSYQNRVSPTSVDSDDELSEFGSVGGLYGHTASNASGSNPGICILNKQCMDLGMPVKAKKS